MSASLLATCWLPTKTEGEHDAVKFKLGKSQLKKSRYYWVNVDGDGLKLDPFKIQAFIDMTNPKDMDAVTRLVECLLSCHHLFQTSQMFWTL